VGAREGRRPTQGFASPSLGIVVGPYVHVVVAVWSQGIGVHLGMTDESYISPFRKVHLEVQAAKDRIRESNELKAEVRQKNAKAEAVREGFDRSST
jgi:hypothetical protein